MSYCLELKLEEEPNHKTKTSITVQMEIEKGLEV